MLLSLWYSVRCIGVLPVNRYSFTQKLTSLVGMDVGLTYIDEALPRDITDMRSAVGALLLTSLVLTAGLAMGKVLQDY